MKNTPAQVDQLALRAQRGDVAARAELLRAVDRLLASIARRFYGVDHEDLHQEARLGFLRALETWKPGRGLHFPAYVTLWARARCSYAATYAASRRATEVHHERADGEGEDELGVVPFDFGDDGEHAAAIIDVIAFRALDRALNRMKPASSYVIRARMRGETLEAVGHAVGTSKETIRKREPRLLASLRARARVDQVVGHG